MTDVWCDVPYERQQDERTCGAACLCMVYRSFGAVCSQAEIGPGIRSAGPDDRRGVRTHRLAQDALRRGYAALILQARNPWGLLQRRAPETRIVLNHRATPRSRQGHFSVLVRAADDHVLLHDPLLGPARRLSRDQWLELWRPDLAGGRCHGHILVALSKPVPASGPCRDCGTGLALAVPCRQCDRPIPLQPASFLGCTAPGCRARMWEFLFCPFCDARWPAPRV